MNQLSVDVIHFHLLPFLTPLELVRFRSISRVACRTVDRYLHEQYPTVRRLVDVACPRCAGWISRQALDTYDEFFDVFCPFERQQRWVSIWNYLPTKKPLIRTSLLCEECEYDEVEWDHQCSDEYTVRKLLPYRGDRLYYFAFLSDQFVVLTLHTNDHVVRWNQFRAVT